MNKKLRDFFINLSDKDADEIWLELDSNADIIYDMIVVILKSHKNISETEKKFLSSYLKKKEQ
jgi:hypothetical protein